MIERGAELRGMQGLVTRRSRLKPLLQGQEPRGDCPCGSGFSRDRRAMTWQERIFAEVRA